MGRKESEEEKKESGERKGRKKEGEIEIYFEWHELNIKPQNYGISGL